SGMIEYQGGGYVHVLSANTLTSGRSFSLRYLHLSEYAFYRDARTLCTGLMQCVPDDPDTMIVKESTANGMGGPFYEDWMAAVSGQSDWSPLFFPWFDHPEYRRAVSDPARFQDSLSREERHDQERYKLNLEQLHWRRWCMKNNCDGSADKFKQEYPGNPEEAFLRSGRPRFSITALAKMPIMRDPLEGELLEQSAGPKKSIIFMPNEQGAVTLYRKPAVGHEYVIGVDVSEGINANAESSSNADPDFSVAFVADRANGEQVAKLRGRIEPGPFGDYLDVLARWYNWAFLVPEANGPGIALLEILLRNGYPPSLIYRRRPMPDEQFASDASNSLQFLGFKTSQVTREQLLSAHDMQIREFGIILRDANTVAEHNSFVYSKRNKAEAQSGCHDDEVIAAALATIGLLHPPPNRSLLGLARPKPPGHMPPPNSIRKYGSRRWAS
ncbi:MAG: hypothetical protein M3N54_12825, partial [Acidobacteriota bacterium]|nr:hypothetical protein [Acidobacteriota bacterium]